MRIGIDVGGTKTEGIALGEGGRELVRRRVESVPDYPGTLELIAALIGEIERETGERGTVGVGIPGTVSATTGLVKNANSTWLNGHPFDHDLAERLGRPVRLMNDANCFVLSEATDGAGAGAAMVFGVILGTGVGGGLVFDRRCHVGVNQIAGEWGHNPLPWARPDEIPGPACYCGKSGCIETFLSGPGLERDHAERAPRPLSTRAILAAAREGDEAAVASLARYHDRLGRGLASVINVVDPDVVVLGGGMSNLPDLAGAAAAVVERYVFSDTLRTRIVRNLHGDSSGVRGAAWLWPDEP